MEDIPITATWYRFIETRGQKLAESDSKKIHKRDEIIGSFSNKFRESEGYGKRNGRGRSWKRCNGCTIKVGF